VLIPLLFGISRVPERWRAPLVALHGADLVAGWSFARAKLYPDYQNRSCAFSFPDRLGLVGQPL
jgi:hypothetical protein